MGKNNKRNRSHLGKTVWAGHKLQPLQSGLTSISGNNRAIKLIDVKSDIASLFSDKDQGIFKKYLAHYHAYGTAPGLVKFLVILAQNGATFTDGNFVFGYSILDGLDPLIDKPFKAFDLGNLIIDQTSQAIASDEYSSTKAKTFNWTKIFQYGSFVTENALKTDTPEIWIIGIECSAEAANPVIIDAVREIAWETKAKDIEMGF